MLSIIICQLIYHKNKTSKFKFNDINNLINNIKYNTISEANAKKKKKLNETQKVETKDKRLIKSQEKLLSLFGDLVEAILNNNNNNSNNNNNESNNKKESKNENENENENENKNENENENENESENENENDNEQYKIKQINNSFKNIDEKKSFEDQINIFKKLP